ncbi:MAG TPA: DUF192 domain-containing protein [Chloroflexi bacterium]|nr:DUF192 domain-containing protein [Chloroflexota bacterium]
MLVNKTKGIVLAEKVKICRTFWGKARGLMFRRNLNPGEALVFVNHRSSRMEASIHMLFVFFPIAVVWLDEQGRVVDKTLAKPFRLWYVPSLPARYYIEGHPHLLREVEVGDEISFEESG